MNLNFPGSAELHELEKSYAQKEEMERIEEAPGRGKKKAFTPFRTKYEADSQAGKIHAVEQELNKLKEIQSRVLDMKETLEETIEREAKKAQEKETKEIKNKYRQRVKELEMHYLRKEEEMRKEYEDKLKRAIERLKEAAKHSIEAKVAERTEKIRKVIEGKALETRLRDKAVIEKLSQMYTNLKDMYKRDVQNLKPE